MAQKRFLNPYNFIRPLPAPRRIRELEDKLKNSPDQISQDEAEQILLWRCPPPPHDRYTGLSGRITCTMTAKTPVFVSEGEPSHIEELPNDKKHPHYHFFNVNGEDMIPASSLRGPIRSVFEAATNSTFGAFTFKDEPLFYRQPPEVALGLVPARVERDESSESGYRLRLLTGSFDLKIGSTKLYAAWIPQYPNPGTKRPKHCLTETVEIPSELQNGQVECWAYIVNTKHLIQRETAHENQRKGFPHWQVEYIAKTEQEARNWFKGLPNDRKKQKSDKQEAHYKLVSGYVYATGLNTDVKQYERFFYYGQGEYYAQLTQGNIDDYNHLMSDYYKRRDSIRNSLNNTERKDIQPSRFIQKLEQLKEGTLVYADLEGTDANPTIRAIYPVAISRAMYECTIRDVINNHHSHLLPPTDINKLCLASRVFGWVSQEKPQTEEERRKNLEKDVAYRGRVRFSSATVTHGIKNDTPLTLSILGTPHPTSLEFYLWEEIEHIKARGDGQHGYDEPNARIRGRKMYRHHKEWRTAEDSTTKKEATTSDKSNQNRTIQGVYEPGSMWTFTIEFENLQPIELGALLWTLELCEDNKRAYHRIGYGKPLGFGSVQIDVTGLELFNAGTRYTLAQTGLEDGLAHKSKLIQRFRDGMSCLYNNDRSFVELDNIQDLLALLSERDDDLPIHYPRLNKDKGGKGNEGFQWFVINRDGKKGKQERLSLAHEDKGLPYYENRGRNRR